MMFKDICKWDLLHLTMPKTVEVNGNNNNEAPYILLLLFWKAVLTLNTGRSNSCSIAVADESCSDCYENDD